MSPSMFDWRYSGVPVHTQEALENYFLRGYEPGSFLMALLQNDLVGAVCRADSENGKCLKNIVVWVLNYAPSDSHGNKERVYNWLSDKDGVRTTYATLVEQKYMWNKLKEPVNG